MGLLKAFFKRKVGAFGIAGEKEGQNGTETAVPGFDKLNLDETRGHGATGLLSVQSNANSLGNPEARAGILGQNPLDSMLDISVRSHETVDYTHDDDEACDVNQQAEDANSSHPNGTGDSPSVEGSTAAPSPEPDSDDFSTSLSVSDGPDSSESALEEEIIGEEIPHQPPPTSQTTGDLTAEALAPLQSMVYLTEDGENMADTMSVVSDSFHEGELPTELSELERALESLETQGATIITNNSAAETSPAAAAAAAAAAAVAMQAAAGPSSLLPSSPGGSISNASFNTAPEHFTKNMVKLYNDLALRLMDGKEYSQALNLLRKAEALLDNDGAWVPGGDEGGSGSIGGSFNLGRRESFGLEHLDESLDESGTPIDDGASADLLARIAAKRSHLRAITYNNIGCLYKRQGIPEQALPYLHNALALEEASGNVHDCASTHLNLCASYSALSDYKEALGHAERAIILLQRQLWGPTAVSFQEGITYLGRSLGALNARVSAGVGDGSVPGSAAAFADAHKRQRKLLASANILAMAYHNAAVEHERLSRMREAQVSYARACSIGTKFLGPKSSTTTALMHAQKGFLARLQRDSASGGGGHHSGAHGHVHTHGHSSSTSSASAARKAPGTRSSSSMGSLLGGKGRQTVSTKKGLLGGTSSRGVGTASRSTTASKLGRDRR